MASTHIKGMYAALLGAPTPKDKQHRASGPHLGRPAVTLCGQISESALAVYAGEFTHEPEEGPCSENQSSGMEGKRLKSRREGPGLPQGRDPGWKEL